ncbi:hypothetical protein [Pseudomonas ogarae]
MPSSSDHSRLAYSETSSELFDQGLFVSVKVPATFATEDGAAELYLVDSTYSLIAQGVGRLDVDLVPGQYYVRQRVGDTENVQVFQVVAEQPANFSLQRLDFATPIPLPESTLAKGAGLEHRVLDTQKGNFRLLLWTPISGPAPASALKQALESLSLETFDGQRHVDLAAEIDEHSVWIALNLQPGNYVLVQRITPGSQRCLPLRVATGLVTSVYLVLLRDDSGREIPLDLQHAAITLLPSSMNASDIVGPLRRLEAARKALALGRQISGWSAWNKAAGAENPLLALIDDDWAGALVPFDSSVLGDAELMVLDIARGQPLPDVLTGPPLLRRSWSRLLQMPSGNDALLALFPFDYKIESSNAWFIWSEAPGARTSRALVKSAEISKTAPGMLSILAGLASVFSRFRKSDVHPAPVGVADDAPTYEDLVQLFTGLIESPMARKLLRKTYRALENQVEGERDPAVQLMFSALETMTDKTLLKAMGAEHLVRSALSSLELPEERRIEHARSLFWLLQQQLSEEDRKFTAGLIRTAGHWLWGRTIEE